MGVKEEEETKRKTRRKRRRSGRKRRRRKQNKTRRTFRNDREVRLDTRGDIINVSGRKCGSIATTI